MKKFMLALFLTFVFASVAQAYDEDAQVSKKPDKITVAETLIEDLCSQKKHNGAGKYSRIMRKILKVIIKMK